MNRLLLTLCAMALMALSCSVNDSPDMNDSMTNPMGRLLPGLHEAYVMVGKYNEMGCELTDDLDRKWLLDTHIINGQLPEGRGLLTYQLYDGHIDGYDVLAFMEGIVGFSISDAIVAPTVAEQEALGTDPIIVQNIHLSENGKWVDVTFAIYTTSSSGTHQFSLAAIPEGDEYRYVLYHKGQNVLYGNTYLQARVSFRLPDEVNPVKNDKSGINVQFVNTRGNLQDIFLSTSFPTSITPPEFGIK